MFRDYANEHVIVLTETQVIQLSKVLSRRLPTNMRNCRTALGLTGRAKVHDSMTELGMTVVNVVASTQLSIPLDLETLARVLANATYRPETFSGLIYRRIQPKATLIMFSTGKLVSVGTRSVAGAKEAIYATINELRNVTPSVRTAEEIRVVNMVVTADFDMRIDLIGLQYALPDSMYEPDQFPGLIMTTSSGATLLAFATGRVVCTGSRGEAEALAQLLWLYDLLT